MLYAKGVVFKPFWSEIPHRFRDHFGSIFSTKSTILLCVFSVKSIQLSVPFLDLLNDAILIAVSDIGF